MLKHIILSAVLATGAVASTAAWADDIKTITRPDGTSVKIIHRGGVYGDGYYNPDHTWVKVTTDAAGGKTIDRSDGSHTTVSPSGNTRSTTTPDGTTVTTQHTDN